MKIEFSQDEVRQIIISHVRTIVPTDGKVIKFIEPVSRYATGATTIEIATPKVKATTEPAPEMPHGDDPTNYDDAVIPGQLFVPSNAPAPSDADLIF